jgi:mono/diheme cytochrome c family protein
MAVYLKSQARLAQDKPGPVNPMASRRLLPDVQTRGADLYDKHCAECHGEHGQGIAGAYPALAGHRAVLQTDTTNLVQNVLYGGYPPATAGNPRPFGMPPYVLTLTEQEVADLLSYLRASWGHQAAPVSALDVQRLRDGAAR